MKYRSIDIIKKIYFSFCGLLPNRIFHFWRGNALVLLYHRVLINEGSETIFNPNSYNNISSQNFDRHISELASKYKVVSIDQLYQHIVQKRDDFVVSITFDDGYKDNLTYALPILEKYGVPATIYITTRFPEGDTWMWWYELWDYILGVDCVMIDFQGKTKKWVTSCSSEKLRCYKDLSNMIMQLEYDEQKSFAEVVTKLPIRPQYPQLCLNWDEIITLDTHPLVTIGAHTHTHSALAMISEEKSLLEMEQSKAFLENKLGHPIETVAYPFGTANTATQREFNCAAICGFRTGLTTCPVPLMTQSLHSIPRLGVPYFINVLGLRAKLSGCEYFFRKIMMQNTSV